MAVVLALSCVLMGAVLWVGPANERLRPGRLSALTRGQVPSAWRRLVHRWKRRSRHDDQRQEIATFLMAFADELSTGLPVTHALQRAGGKYSWLSHTVGSSQSGGDVAAALRADALAVSSSALSGLSAAWQVSAGSGAGLARAAKSLGHSAQQRERMRRELASQMAGPKGTARVLAVLPLVGLILGSGFGGSPVRWLTSTPPGLVVLAVGLILEVLGLIWVRRLVSRVERHL